MKNKPIRSWNKNIFKPRDTLFANLIYINIDKIIKFDKCFFSIHLFDYVKELLGLTYQWFVKWKLDSSFRGFLNFSWRFAYKSFYKLKKTEKLQKNFINL